MTTERDVIDLAEAIKAVRLQLKEASANAEQDQMQMDVDSLEMEFTVEVRRDRKISGGVKAWVISTGADTTHVTSGTHRVKISLKPKMRITGESVKVGDECDNSLSEAMPFS
ncbi:trypco2 family protein [Streptomyces sp. NPDC046985]|uniref:trypco2 family protein n=1 Tax=Streptomyces sp. NPDC046985 TaxID=3155377 RepID=UPI0033FAC1EE